MICNCRIVPAMQMALQVVLVEDRMALQVVLVEELPMEF